MIKWNLLIKKGLIVNMVYIGSEVERLNLHGCVCGAYISNQLKKRSQTVKVEAESLNLYYRLFLTTEIAL